MKYSNWVSGLLMAGLLVFSGCGKSEKPAPVDNTQFIDATDFRPAFESASPQIKASVNGVMMSLQGGDYDKVLADLEKLASLPDLNDSQKKAVTNLSGQVKKKMDKLAQ